MESNQKRVYITRKLPSIAKQLLTDLFIVDENPDNLPLNHQELYSLVQNYDVILSTPVDKFDKDILSKKQKLRVISNFGVGLDNIDLPFAKEVGIRVFNTRDSVTNSTADHTFAIFLSLIRKCYAAQNFVKEGNWKYWDPYLFLGEELRNKTFGIIGFGSIGKAVAQRAIGFELNVIYYDSQNSIDTQSIDNRIKKVSFDELLEQSDFISLHIPLNNENRFLVNTELINKMKKNPVIINTSRGEIINTGDIIEALKNKSIRGLASDVTFPEPINQDNELLKFENCLITPHIATATAETRYNMAKQAAENIINFYNQIKEK